MTMTIDELIEQAHRTAVEKGWWEGGDRPVLEQLCLMHAELSEACEEYRSGRGLGTVWFTAEGKPEGFCVELADVLIRIADTLGAYGLQETFAAALEQKLAYNAGRPHRHGGKLA